MVVKQFTEHFRSRMMDRLKVMERRRQQHEIELTEQTERMEKLGDHADKAQLDAEAQKSHKIEFSLRVVKLRLSKYREDMEARAKEMAAKLRSDPCLACIY